jgi:arsenate reductase
MGSTRFKAYSAGSFPTGKVNPYSLKILKLHGIPVEKVSSKPWHDLENIEFDAVITVCDNAAAETCPLYLGKAIKAHWGVEDPDKIKGKSRAMAFEKTYQQMKRRIQELLKLDEITTENLTVIGKIPL